MARPEQVFDSILLGKSDANIRFQDLCRLLEEPGFSQRIRGSHHIFTRDGVQEILNLQPKSGKAKSIKSSRSVR